MNALPRRRFVRMLAGAAGAATAVATRAFGAAGCPGESAAGSGFGPLRPHLPEDGQSLADVPGLGDLRGVPLLRLPDGFRYRALSVTGQLMDDGSPVPARPDGMAWFRRGDGATALVRNHEIDLATWDGIAPPGCRVPAERRYDPFSGAAAGFGGGGTTTLVLGDAGVLGRQFVSLGGTLRNCAGGPTPWGTWLSCEEDVSQPGALTRRPHGYCFEVPAGADGPVAAVPLVAMGRMNREAVSVDVARNEILQTEDRGDAAMYRFVPERRPTAFGDLRRGGRLSALVIDADQRGCDGRFLPVTRLDGADVVDTRGVARGAPGSMRPFVGQALQTRWVTLEDPDPATDSLRVEARHKGAALWWRPEGAWFHDGAHYWVCSGAGDGAEGQVWRYDPAAGTVTLVLESTDETLLDGPDNLTVAADGVLYLCEDGDAGTPGSANYSQYVVGVDRSGGLFALLHNVIPGDTGEFCGVCLSGDQRTLFVNSQTAGITYAVWRDGGRRIALP